MHESCKLGCVHALHQRLLFPLSVRLLGKTTILPINTTTVANHLLLQDTKDTATGNTITRHSHPHDHQRGHSSHRGSHHSAAPPATATATNTMAPDPNYQTIPPSNSGYTSVYLGNPQFNGFDNKKIREDFVSKVFTILGFQLLFASGLIAWFTLHEPTKQYMKESGEVYLWIALAVGMITWLVLVCVESTRRTFPMNFVALLLITIAYGLIAAILAARFETVTVLCAFGATALATFVIILLAKYSPFDLTNCGCALCILALVHLLVTTILIVTLVPAGYAGTAGLIIAGTGAFLISLYMIFDIQLIMGGRSNELSPEEYILAACLLYIDILQLFQYMLILFAGRE